MLLRALLLLQSLCSGLECQDHLSFINSQPMSIGMLVHGTKGTEFDPTPKLSLYRERESPMASEQGASALCPARGQAGSGTLHSGLLDKSAPSWGSSKPFILYFKSGCLDFPQQTVVSGGEGVLAEPPAWEGLLRHFASPWNPSFTLSSVLCL